MLHRFSGSPVFGLMEPAKSGDSLFNYSTTVTTFSIFKVLCFHLKLPLGVILKNENINGEMIEIMETLHQYVPTKNVGSSREIAEHYLFGGDQLTCT